MIAGPQQGQRGQVLRVIRPTGQVLVEGIRLVRGGWLVGLSGLGG